MKRPVRISADPLFDMAKHLVQEFVRIRPNREDDREAILLALCTRTFKTNVRYINIYTLFGRNCNSLCQIDHCIHGDKKTCS